MSTFNIFGIAFSGLAANQRAIEVLGHNVANVNTPGYHRQEAVQEARPARPVPGSIMAQSGGQFGTGVDVTTVRRMQNVFLDQQLRSTQGQIGQWSMAKDALEQIESFLAPGQGLDLSSMLDRFFGAWQQLASHPEELSSRLSVRNEGMNLTNTLNQLSGQFDFLAAQLDSNLSTRVDRLNLLADELADLNGQISVAETEGRAPNDLMDRRDTVLEEMTRLAGVRSLSLDEGNSITNLGGRAMVQGTYVEHLAVVLGPTGMQAVWESDGAAANVPSGEVSSLYQMRDTVIPGYQAQLDDVALALSTAINGLHGAGVNMHNLAAGDFFVGTTAGSIRVHDDIVADAGVIAATTNFDAIGDGSLATQLYELCNATLIGSQTLNQSAQSLIGQIGNAVQTAQTGLSASEAVQEQLFRQQQSIVGVSIDEEMTDMLRFQRAYDASARVLSAADEMIRVLLEQMR